MGAAMAGRLLNAGHAVGVYNRTASKADVLVSNGATLLASLAEAAVFGEVVITMLENDAALSAIVGGADGLVSTMPQGAIHVAMGTHSVAFVKAMTEPHADAGVRFISAPVLGRPPAAAAGELGIIVGGAPDAVTACQPLFDAMGRRTYSAGVEPVGAAAAKIVNNMILVCAIEALGEGFALARRLGLPEDSLLEILTDGLFSSPAYQVYGPIIAQEDYFAAPGFSATTGLKDVMLALNAGEIAGVPLPSVDICRDRLLSAIANGFGDADWSVMAYEPAVASASPE